MVIVFVVSPVFHNNLPIALVESVELPQIFVIMTTGFAGVFLGAAVPVPGALVQPLTVVVTV